LLIILISLEYKTKIGYEGQLLIEPKAKEPTRHQYDYGKYNFRAHWFHNKFSAYTVCLELIQGDGTLADNIVAKFKLILIIADCCI